MDESFVDQYRVSLPVGGPLTVQLDSVDFDAYLFVTDDTLGQIVAQDDDSGAGTNSLLADLPLGPGAYRILATSFSEGEIGAYTLTLVPEPSGPWRAGVGLALAAALARVGRTGGRGGTPARMPRSPGRARQSPLAGPPSPRDAQRGAWTS